MPLFLSNSVDPFSIHVDYVKDSLGNTIAVAIPIDIWNKLLKRYNTIFINEDVSETASTEEQRR